MNKIYLLLITVFTLFGIAIPAYALPVFEYEIWMQSETSLDIGNIKVQGQIVNTGMVSLDLTAQWSALGGTPSNLNSTTCGLECLNAQLNEKVLNPGGTFYFTWLSGTQEENLSNRSGELLSGSVGLIPLGSDWNWTSGGFIPELLVSSVWVNGPADTTLQFNKTKINLEVAGQYINSSPLASVPEPNTLLLLGSGIVWIGFVRKKFKARNLE